MYGGIKFKSSGSNYGMNFINKQTTNELWSFNLETNKWFLLNLNESSTSSTTTTTTYLHGGFPSNNLKNYMLPLSVSGHSMHLINQSLFIYFGYSEFYGTTLNLIQEYKLGKSDKKLIFV